MSEGTPVYLFNPSNSSPPIHSEDMLLYMADLLAELEALAKQRQFGRLADLLSETAAEARRLSDEAQDAR